MTEAFDVTYELVLNCLHYTTQAECPGFYKLGVFFCSADVRIENEHETNKRSFTTIYLSALWFHNNRNLCHTLDTQRHPVGDDISHERAAAVIPAVSEGVIQRLRLSGREKECREFSSSDR